jgi:hypothetical protein
MFHPPPAHLPLGKLLREQFKPFILHHAAAFFPYQLGKRVAPAIKGSAAD